MKRLLLMLIALMASAPCEAHNDYPYSCCGNLDCGPILEMYTNPDGSRYITIETIQGQRKALFPAAAPVQPSIDDKNHACILNSGAAGCLFLKGDF